MTMNSSMKKLINLYLDESKHSSYQNVPEFLQHDIDITEHLTPLWRDDRCRFDLLNKHYNFETLNSVADIGANTGYFSLSLAKMHPSILIKAIEGNPKHAEFIKNACRFADIQNLIISTTFYDSKTPSDIFSSDLVLYFNVLHHLGADHNQDHIQLDNFNEHAINCLSNIARHSTQMIFQMGFNWGGNKSQPIIPLNDDIGKIQYLTMLMKRSRFNIDSIALPLLNTNKDAYQYREYPSSVIGSFTEYQKLLNHHKITELSEFFRRPILFCTSTA